MTTDHRAEAERLLADADEWAAQAGELNPKASERACLDRAQVHALLAIHDTLTDRAAADRYAANEERQREEAEPDPLDEDDHRDRLDRDGNIVRRKGREWWAWPEFQGFHENVGWSLSSIDRSDGPLTFAPEPPPDGARDDLTAVEGDSGSVEGDSSHAALEALLCPECGHDIDDHNGDPDAPGEWCAGCDDCRLTPSDVAHALIAEVVKAERGRLAREVREWAPRVIGNQGTLTDLAARWEQQ